MTTKDKNEYPENVVEYWDEFAKYNANSTQALYDLLPDLTDKKILDVGCGNGYDMITYRNRGARWIAGIDTSKDMIDALRSKEYADELVHGDILLSYPSETVFDVAVSKWSLQCVSDYSLAISNIARLLTSGGTMILLVVHPLRQFLKKERGKRDYFTQEVVESSLFDGQLIVHEPSHTVADLLSPTFFKYFDLEVLEEGKEIGCSKVDGDIYPQYILIKAKRR